MAVYGIDVSKWQGAINWHEVAATPIDKYGEHVQFAFIKATEGSDATGASDAQAIAEFAEDPEFRANVAGARAAGLVLGFYHFARPDLGNSPEAEAAWFCSRVLPVLEPGDLLALDLEVRGGNYAAWAARWLAYVRARAGFEPLFYTYRSYFAEHGITFSDIGSQAGLWLAAPGVTGFPAPMAGWPVLALWQMTTRAVPGVPGNVDWDAFNGDLSHLLKYGKPGLLFGPGSGSVTPPAPKPVPAPTPKPAPVPTPPDYSKDPEAPSSPVGQDTLPTPPASHGGSMSDNPTPAPVAAPDVPEPVVVAEAGVTTSEWKLALGYLAQAAAAVTAEAVNSVAQAVWHTSVSVPAPVLNLAVQLEFGAALVVGSYVVSRGIRKLYAK